MQVPELQKWPAAQSPSVPQLSGHAGETPLHTNGAHAGFAPAAPAARTVHVPAVALHTSQPPAQTVLQQYPSTQ